jgi:hypothetical protein
MAKIPRPGEAIVFCIHMQERNKEKKRKIITKHTTMHQQFEN